MKKVMILISFSLLLISFGASLIPSKPVPTPSPTSPTTVSENDSSIDVPAWTTLPTRPPENTQSQLAILQQEHQDLSSGIYKLEQTINTLSNQLLNLHSEFIPLVTTLSIESLDHLIDQVVNLNHHVVHPDNKIFHTETITLFEQAILLIRGYLANPQDDALIPLFESIQQEIEQLWNAPIEQSYLQLILSSLTNKNGTFTLYNALYHLNQDLQYFSKTYLDSKSPLGQTFKRQHQQVTSTQSALTQQTQHLEKLKGYQLDVTQLLNEVTP